MLKLWPTLLLLTLCFKPLGSLGAEPLRWVSLSPAMTQMIVESGGGKYLIGVTRYCRWPDGSESPPTRVGGALDPDLEIIFSLRPDRVIAGSLLPHDTQRKLERLGIPVTLFRQNSLADVIDQMSWIQRELEGSLSSSSGSLNGATHEYLEDLRKRWQTSADASPHPSRRVRALMVFSSGMEIAAGAQSYGAEILNAAGWVNASDTLAGAWPSPGREWLLKEDPDWLVLATHQPRSETEEIKRKALERWRADRLLSRLEAVRHGRVLVVGDNVLGVPGAGLFEVIDQLKLARQHAERSDHDF
ncbi:MAG: ABC transporter substrate-binding protein [Candidatus Methylacidiphilales bacterium]